MQQLRRDGAFNALLAMQVGVLLLAAMPEAYWPFHKAECRKCEFADAIEREDPKFARWMRRHKKLAVLKDDEVDRLERAQHASIGPSREEVMESMYGRLNPKPIEPSYSPEELRKMEMIEEDEKRRKMLVSERDRRWKEVDVNQTLGIDCSSEAEARKRNGGRGGHLPYKWDQNQAYVEVHVLLPAEISPTAYRDLVRVSLTPTVLEINLREDGVGGDTGGRKIWGGALFADVKVDESAWLIRDGIVEFTLLKRSRRGCYANGHTNADTFWFSLFKDARDGERIVADAVPSAYYKSFYETDAKEPHKLRGRPGFTPMIASSRK